MKFTKINEYLLCCSISLLHFDSRNNKSNYFLYIIGASTAEAQQRVAVEIAQQFLGLSDKSAEYAVTGIVNAPVLSAAMTNENEPWIELSKKLGQLAGRFLKGKLNTIIHSQTVGSGMQDKQFIHKAVLVGILTGQTKNGLNLINAPTLAQDIGIRLQESHVEDDNKAVIVKVGEHTIKGNIKYRNETFFRILKRVEMNNRFELSIESIIKRFRF